APAGLFPDLARGARLVSARIRFVRVLVDVEPPPRFVLRELPGEANGPIGLLERVAEDDAGAEVPRDALARFAHVLRHHQRDGELQRRSDPGISDAGVPAGGI